jgi:hypothetical protein
MEDWTTIKKQELLKLEQKARFAMECDKDKPHFKDMIDAYISGYIQSQMDDCIKVLKH